MAPRQINLFNDDHQPEELTPESATKADPAAKPIVLGVRDGNAYEEIKEYYHLEQKALACSKCRLRQGCQQVVFGCGNIKASLMFIGEGPGQEEDLQGKPFVGKAGQLLNKIFAAAEIKREDVYITNVVKCRPPQNRIPKPDETRICRSYLEAQIRLIDPRIIVCLGALACQTIIDPQARISVVRGQWYMKRNIKIMATYHPAALLRNEDFKKPAWEDFKMIRNAYQKCINP